MTADVSRDPCRDRDGTGAHAVPQRLPGRVAWVARFGGASGACHTIRSLYNQAPLRRVFAYDKGCDNLKDGDEWKKTKASGNPQT